MAEGGGKGEGFKELEGYGAEGVDGEPGAGLEEGLC